MKHICKARFGNYEFNIAVDESVDNKGMFRLIDEDTGEEIEDMFETVEDATKAVFVKYPDNDM